ncbi:MAG: amidase family protein [Hyphomicrobiales bacterium]
MNKRNFLGFCGSAALSTAFFNRFSVPVFARASDDFVGLDATAQSELFKSGKVSAVELVEAAIRRIEVYDGQLNSVVIKAYEQTRAQAKTAKPEDGPFAGIPYLLKCLMAKKGQVHSWASRARAFEVAEASDPVTDAFEKTGAIYLGQSNAPEYGSIASTESNLYGRGRNPFDLARGPAGSSGGSAIAVAAGLVPIATADDGGGSIRMPAAACGLVGLKCSRAREEGHEESLLVNTGRVSSSVRDTATVIDAFERKDNADLPAIGRITGPSKERLKVAFTNVGLKRKPRPIQTWQRERKLQPNCLKGWGTMSKRHALR